MASTVLYLGNLAIGYTNWDNATYTDLQLVSVNGIDSGGRDGITTWDYTLNGALVTSLQNFTGYFNEGDTGPICEDGFSDLSRSFLIVQLDNGDVFVTDNYSDSADSSLDNEVLAGFTVGTCTRRFGRFTTSTITGAPSESLFPGAEALKSLSLEAKEAIFSLFPEIADPGFAPATVRPVPAGKEQRQLIDRHGENDRALLSAQ